MNTELVMTVTDFVALLNQTLEFAYPNVTIVGELANFRISKNRWVYFDLKDEHCSVKFFGTVYQLSGPLEDGLMLKVSGVPRLHPQFGFSVNVQSMNPVGEGSIKKASSLLEVKLKKEGLFESTRKRQVPYPPKTIGLIASGESAAYHDFIKILNERWCGVEVLLANVQVQGESASGQVIRAIEYFNIQATPVDAIVITRGGGSADDLAVFSTEQVTRAVAASRIPTVVAIGHEVDVSLAEMAADLRASTPSNAAQLLFPEKTSELLTLRTARKNFYTLTMAQISNNAVALQEVRKFIDQIMTSLLSGIHEYVLLNKKIVLALSPNGVLKRGYAVLRQNGKVIRFTKDIALNKNITLQLNDGIASGLINKVDVQ